MRRYQKWPIYATKRMVEIIPQLCLKGEKHTVVANVLFHCLGSGISDPEYNTIFRNDYMETLNHLYNNRMKFENVTDSNKGVKELVFSPFNLKLVNEVSPTIYTSQKDHLISSLEESLQKFSMYYTNVKENIDLNSLFHSVGVDFVKVIKLLRLEHKINELTHETINEFFETLMKGVDLDRIKALEFLEMILVDKKHDLYTPLVPGSLRLVDVLVSIVEAECLTSLELFYKVVPKEIHDQCLEFLKSTNTHTGLLLYHWGYIESDNIINNPDKTYTRDKIKQPDISSKVDECVVDKMIVNSVASIYATYNTLKGLVYSSNGFNSLEKPNTFKNHISVHFEPDLVVISTQKDIFIVDLLIRDSLYKSSLFNLLNFILSCNLVKVGHMFMLNVAKLSCQFSEPFKKYNFIVDLNNKRVKKIRNYKDDTVQESNIFRPTGFTKSLTGLLQEFNVPLPPRKRWKLDYRPISVERIKYLSILARGILSVEYQLRSQGWMPSSICDTSFTDRSDNTITLYTSDKDKEFYNEDLIKK